MSYHRTWLWQTDSWCGNRVASSIIKQKTKKKPNRFFIFNMGLLKLGSIYKSRQKTKEKQAPLQPLKIELESPLRISTLPTKSPVSTVVAEQQAPAGSGSLLDDIFSELNSKPFAVAPVKEDYQDDASLAMALAQSLYLEESQDDKHTHNREDSSLSTSIFASLLSPSLSTYSSTTTTPGSAAASLGRSNQSVSSPTLATSSRSIMETHQQQVPQMPPPKPSPAVLDSDLSDSDEVSDSDGHLSDASGPRRTKGMQPIMARRTQDHRLMVQRKIDRWTDRVDADATLVETNESMIARMKDRHRQQFKMAAMRSQQQQQQQQFQQPPMMAPLPPPIVGGVNMIPPFVMPMVVPPYQGRVYNNAPEYADPINVMAYPSMPTLTSPIEPPRPRYARSSVPASPVLTAESAGSVSSPSSTHSSQQPASTPSLTPASEPVQQSQVAPEADADDEEEDDRPVIEKRKSRRSLRKEPRENHVDRKDEGPVEMAPKKEKQQKQHQQQQYEWERMQAYQRDQHKKYGQPQMPRSMTSPLSPSDMHYYDRSIQSQTQAHSNYPYPPSMR
ncbi:hypothetical protein PHYBLDRAFT_185602 [Phycomyces blakesleeanus NRRL 1555(-)]|uniref:Uncharacterized protein n=1 Tax=Phycomyces blakesleeanus (strain ATCC 8743b / DSM 1359 / FGSC 10004 / NBRC 33097 / NRRL 1555) TaxID=763407 RepID=A0A167PDQ2_PHYB8|nr:hypothetical protein PHYBLDRAFT_185602 [Phycomyces blakesleeanus NRRL 1555(-)]OAD77724.1 hypothetical protein PHYBLDRAFT_185602 [Phycomyces blakesleeanus NRRL 1555(-)]|eukprot:XP_018295764.1 hypothetical protein PHYBLDRAFT_185602 [Phycomyces blakesleeanus NRRL 1555(-)]